MRARVLRELDESHGHVDDRAIVADRIVVSQHTVRQVAKRFVETRGDIEATISRKQRQMPPIVTGDRDRRS